MNYYQMFKYNWPAFKINITYEVDMFKIPFTRLIFIYGAKMILAIKLT